jgi:hypothetical protein
LVEREFSAFTSVAGFQEASLCGDSEELAPNNPFLQKQQKETSFDLAMQAVQVNFILFV